MALPTLAVEVAFVDDPLDAAAGLTWTDITDYVRDIRTSRGRHRQLDTVKAGTCTVALEDIDGRFRPGNTAGAYSPNVQPMKRLRVTATWSMVTYTIFVGFIDRWPQQWPVGETVEVVATCTDAFKLLNRLELPASVYEVEVAADNPDWWWRLDETRGDVAVDHGPDGNHGSYQGHAQPGGDNLERFSDRAAVTFTDDDGAMVVDTFKALTKPFTVEMILRYPKLRPLDAGFTFNHVLSINGQATIEIDETTSALSIAAHTVDDPATVYGKVIAASDYETVHHLIFIFQADDTIDVYEDGDDVTTSSSTSGTAGYGAGLRLGYFGYDEAGLGAPAMSVGQLAIYTSALSSARRTAHADAFTGPWSGESSGERAEQILDLVGWPAADRNIDVGNSDPVAAAGWPLGTTALQYLQLLEQTEAGLLFVARDGDVRFIERHAWITGDAKYTDPAKTFTDDATLAADHHNYRRLDIDYDDDLANEVTVQRQHSSPQTAVDDDSVTAFGRQTLTLSGLLMRTDNEALDLANATLIGNANPRLQVVALELEPEFDDDLWPVVLAADLGERHTIERTPPVGGDQFTQDSLLQGIDHHVSFRRGQARWVVTCWFAPSLEDAGDLSFLVLNDATKGKLNQNNLGY